MRSQFLFRVFSVADSNSHTLTFIFREREGGVNSMDHVHDEQDQKEEQYEALGQPCN